MNTVGSFIAFGFMLILPNVALGSTSGASESSLLGRWYWEKIYTESTGAEKTTYKSCVYTENLDWGKGNIRFELNLEENIAGTEYTALIQILGAGSINWSVRGDVWQDSIVYADLWIAEAKAQKNGTVSKNDEIPAEISLYLSRRAADMEREYRRYFFFPGNVMQSRIVKVSGSQIVTVSKEDSGEDVEDEFYRVSEFGYGCR